MAEVPPSPALRSPHATQLARKQMSAPSAADLDHPQASHPQRPATAAALAQHRTPPPPASPPWTTSPPPTQPWASSTGPDRFLSVRQGASNSPRYTHGQSDPHLSSFVLREGIIRVNHRCHHLERINIHRDLRFVEGRPTVSSQSWYFFCAGRRSQLASQSWYLSSL
jgi:hypothetical protein